ncbi:hypothetical protein MauCBS54593_005093 [Microsporum audouinii]
MTRNSHVAGRTRETRKSSVATKTSTKPKNINPSQFVPDTRHMRGQKEVKACRPRPRALLEYSGAAGSNSKLPVKVSIQHAIDQAVRETRGADSSSDEEEFDPPATPGEPDLFYSFDAYASPAQGGDVLSAAVVLAIDKFETKQTEKLAREYEFIGLVDPDDLNEGYGGHDDGFELIEAVNY